MHKDYDDHTPQTQNYFELTTDNNVEKFEFLWLQ